MCVCVCVGGGGGGGGEGGGGGSFNNTQRVKKGKIKSCIMYLSVPGFKRRHQSLTVYLGQS